MVSSVPVTDVLRWPLIQKYFKILEDSPTLKVLKVQCLLCMPLVKELHCAKRSWCSLMTHIKHRHPKKALAIVKSSKKRTWKRKGKPAVTRAIVRKAPRKIRPKRDPVVSTQQLVAEEPKSAVEPPVVAVPTLLREVKEEIVSNASVSHVASESVDSGLPDVMDESSMNFEFVNPIGSSHHYGSSPLDMPHHSRVTPIEQCRSNMDEHHESADISFLKSLLPDMSKMTSRQKHKLKLAILNAVDGILYD